MEVEDRPWVVLDNAVPILVDVEDVGVAITLHLFAKNIGHSPAENVYARGDVYRTLSMTDYRAAAERACHTTTPDGLSFLQTLLLPGESGEVEDGDFIINMNDIRRDRAVEIAQSNIYPAVREEEAREPLRGEFTVVGCISYSYPGAPSLGQTPFILDVYEKCISILGGECTFDLSQRRLYQGGEIGIQSIRTSLFAN